MFPVPRTVYQMTLSPIKGTNSVQFITGKITIFAHFTHICSESVPMNYKLYSGISCIVVGGKQLVRESGKVSKRIH